MDSIVVILLAACLILLVVTIFLLLRGSRGKAGEAQDQLILEQLKSDLEKSAVAQREEINRTTRDCILQLGNHLTEVQSRQATTTDQHLQDKMTLLQSGLTEQLGQFERRLGTFSESTAQNLENVRGTVEKKLTSIQDDNNKKLDEMRVIVDEKLQKTINERMNESFRAVNERLEQVYKGLGEMQTLAQGVGDLKKVLSNVKNRGILGEVQLGSILEDILAPEQYDKNVPTVPNSRNPVEYAVKLPTEDGSFIYLPIDAKFPGDTYAQLRDAYDNGTQEEIQAAVRQLAARIRAEAKDIHDKYIEPPHTTEFGILFLPFEGLYAEVVSRTNLVESLQREFRVNIAGPSTMAALLNSLQMSFRTIAIQKRSGEVWNVLGAVKTEFDKFSDALTATQSRLDQASDELEKLVGVRTRQMKKKLREVTSLDGLKASELLSLPGDEPSDDE